jgi:hypothetical protein
MFFTIDVPALKKQVLSLPEDYQVFKDYIVNSPYNEDCTLSWANNITKYFRLAFEGHEEEEVALLHESSTRAFEHVIKLTNKEIFGYSLLLGLTEPKKDNIEPQKERERAQIIKNYALDKPLNYLKQIVDVDSEILAFNIFMKMAQRSLCIRHDGSLFKSKINGKGDVTIGANYDECRSTLLNNTELYSELRENSGYNKWASQPELEIVKDSNSEIMKMLEQIKKENDALKAQVSKMQEQKQEPKKVNDFGRAKREEEKQAKLAKVNEPSELELG